MWKTLCTRRTRGLVPWLGIACLTVGIAPFALAGESADTGKVDWQVVRQAQGRDGVSTWEHPVKGLSVNAFRGVTEVHHSMLSVLALLADVDNLPHWVFQCQSASRPKGKPLSEFYMRFNGIWPVSDRDVLLRNTISQTGDRTVVIDSRNVKGYPAQSGYVRIPHLHNTFRVTPLHDGWTRVEFDTLVDPGGWVPGWLANMVSTRAPLVTLRGLHQQLDSKAKYRIKSVTDLPAYYLQSGSLVVPDFNLQAPKPAGGP